jgi:excisionase family DNA binding protein
MRKVTIEPLLLRAEEAQEILGLGRTKVYELIRTKELPSVKIGGSVRIPLDELKEWIRQKKT